MALLGVILAFVILIGLSLKGVPLHLTMILATLIMALTSGLPAGQIVLMLSQAFSDKGTLELAAAVFFITVFSSTMQKTGFLDEMVSGLVAFLGNVKAAIIATPALIGSMPVLGGAALSAPLVDRMGDSLGIGPDVKAALNLSARHGMFFVFPFSTGLILSSNLTGFPIPALIRRLWPMSVVLWGVGYLAHLRKTPSDAVSRDASSEVAASATGPVGGLDRKEGLRKFLLYGGPLLLALSVGLIWSLPLWIALSIGMVSAYVLALTQKTRFPTPKEIRERADLNQVITMFWIMGFKAFVDVSPVFPSLVGAATEKGVSTALLALLLPIAIGYSNASQTTTMSVLIPIFVLPSAPADARLAMTVLLYASSFMAYFFSPLHLCQVFTCRYFGVGILDVYKRNLPIFLGFLVVLAYYYKVVAALGSVM